MTTISVSIHQPHYFPWLPFLNKLARSDVFIVYDTVQLPRGKSKVLRAEYMDERGAPRWLSIPAGKAKSSLAPIMDIVLDSLDWRGAHLAKLRNAYLRAPHRDWALDIVGACLDAPASSGLTDVLQGGLQVLCERLGIQTRLVRASELLPYEDVSLQEYVVRLVQRAGGTEYITGRGRGTARTVDEELFEAAGIALDYQDFRISPYAQTGGGEFQPRLSVLDALFMAGPETRGIILGTKEAAC